MSPGATFERVYREIRRQLVEGARPPGAPLEPAAIGTEIAASITPVRDALHRLVGERLVEAPNHNGFRVPQLTEAALRELYLWHGSVLGLATRAFGNARAPIIPPPAATPDQVATAASALFLAIARATESAEHVRAIENLGDRLAPYRRAETQLIGAPVEEYRGLANIVEAGSASQLRTAITRYHRRRASAVPQILASRSPRD